MTEITILVCESVRNYDTGRWEDHTQFAPGRYNDGNGPIDPYGTYRMRVMTTFKLGVQNLKYDIAVVRYQRGGGNNQFIGDNLGWAGARSVTDGDDPKLESVTPPTLIKGYPAEMPPGQAFSVGPCFHNCPPAFLFGCSTHLLSHHVCDSSEGMSGSAVMSSTGYIYGIHVAAHCSREYNIATLLSGIHATNYKRWVESFHALG